MTRWIAVAVALAALTIGFLVLEPDHTSAPQSSTQADTERPIVEAGATGSTDLQPATTPTPNAPVQPNIVVITADDMRADDLVFAPRLQQLMAEGGVTMANSFAPYPLCCPSRASYSTGVYAHNHHVFSHLAPYGYGSFDDSKTLATALTDVGYQTGFVGKYLNQYGIADSLVAKTPSRTYVPNGWADWRASIDGDPAHYRGSTYDYFDTAWNVNGTIDTDHRGEYNSVTIADFSIDMVEKFHKRDAPFYLWTNFVAPHHGVAESDDPQPVRRNNGSIQQFETPARPDWVKGHWDAVINRASGVPRDGGSVEADVSDKPGFWRGRPDLNRAEKLGLRDLTRQRAESITAMDREIGRLIAKLKETGEWDHTVFAFTSDNGYFLGEHRQRTGKVMAHEPSLRVPLLITGPGLRTGEVRDDPATTIDLSATVLDLAGAKAPLGTLDGRSLAPTLWQGDQGWTAPVVTEALIPELKPNAKGFDDARTSIGIRTPQYSFVKYGQGFVELYDLKADPLQMTNVAHDPRYRAVRQHLNELWWQVKDCSGDSCRADLGDLAADPTRLAELTGQYWRAVNRAYGWPTHPQMQGVSATTRLLLAESN